MQYFKIFIKNYWNVWFIYAKLLNIDYLVEQQKYLTNVKNLNIILGNRNEIFQTYNTI